MLLPGVLYFIIFHVWPILGMRLAFYNYQILGPDEFVGMKYFKELFSTPIFEQVIANTLIISAMKMFIIFPVPDSVRPRA